MNVQNLKNYSKNANYKIENIGFQVAIIPRNVLMLIGKYYLMSHNSMKYKRTNKYKDSVADKVEIENLDIVESHYLFIDIDGSIYTKRQFDYELKKYFTKIGIPKNCKMMIMKM